MNHLAHLFLSINDPAGIIGNLSVDFIKGGPIGDRDPAFRLGMKRHLIIDAFTDRHPAFRASRRRIAPPHQRYAGVIVDLFYDHLLARDWDVWAGQSLASFSNWGYDLLQAHDDHLPERLQQVLPYMIRDDWLGLYAHPRGIHRALAGISHRARRPIQLQSALSDLHTHDAALTDDFAAFFPDLIAHLQAHHPGPICGQLPIAGLTRQTMPGPFASWNV